MRRLLELSAGLVLRRVLGGPDRRAGPTRRRQPARSGRGRAPRRAALGRPPGGTAPAARGATAGVRPAGLLPLVLGSLTVGLVTMLIFEEWFTRLIGVLALFTFVISGVFLLTGSGLLDPEDEE
jgi:hypothetical protein